LGLTPLNVYLHRLCIKLAEVPASPLKHLIISAARQGSQRENDLAC
jgi:hypothetical protein